MTGSEEIRDIVHRSAQGLSNHPEEIKTEVVDAGDASLCIVIQCRNNGPRDNDIGLIVGKSGRNIKALRTVIEAVGAKHKLRTTVIVKE